MTTSPLSQLSPCQEPQCLLPGPVTILSILTVLCMATWGLESSSTVRLPLYWQPHSGFFCWYWKLWFPSSANPSWSPPTANSVLTLIYQAHSCLWVFQLLLLPGVLSPSSSMYLTYSLNSWSLCSHVTFLMRSILTAHFHLMIWSLPTGPAPPPDLFFQWFSFLPPGGSYSLSALYFMGLFWILPHHCLRIDSARRHCRDHGLFCSVEVLQTPRAWDGMCKGLDAGLWTWWLDDPDPISGGGNVPRELYLQRSESLVDINWKELLEPSASSAFQLWPCISWAAGRWWLSLWEF